MRKLLSIDGSTTATGWAIYNKDTKELITYGVVKDDGKDRRERVRNMIDGVKDVINEHNPENIVMEDVPPALNNSDTVLLLGILQGGILGLAKQLNTKIEWISVSTWHSGLKFYDGTKEGKSKENMKRNSIAYANNKYGLNLIYKSPSSKFNQDNESDAICIGDFYLNRDEKENKSDKSDGVFKRRK